jgi:hypothetical protein
MCLETLLLLPEVQKIVPALASVLSKTPANELDLKLDE